MPSWLAFRARHPLLLGESPAIPVADNALAGVAIGSAIAVASARLIRGLLFDVSATDPATFVAVAAALIGMALLASYVPARRATRVDPMTALRGE